jgi:glycine/D-amino acid oxidase-like deaminating enzyme
MTSNSSDGADVLVVGDGVIGLASALAIARAGGSCRILGRTVKGAASIASAGLLAPSIGSADPGFREFMLASRDRYPAWVRLLAERTGIEVTLDRSGIIELASTSTEAGARPIASRELHDLEPAMIHTGANALLYADDGYVDNVRFVDALREAVRCEWSIAVVEGRVASIEAGVDHCRATMEDGRRQLARTVVVAAGAWSALIVGAPRPLPIEPVRGQMLQLSGSPLSHAISSPDAYLVPRGDTTLIGSTLERVGFDANTSRAALEHLRSAAVAVVPSFADAEVVSSWAGLRPMTPDSRPIIGRDPDLPSVVYACGHGKNGILLAPLTAECVASLVAGSEPPFDLSHYGAQRFAQ